LKGDLKKQSQFAKGQNVKSVSIMSYGDFGGPMRRKNKAKQSQFLQSACDWNRFMLYTTYLVTESLQTKGKSK